MNNAAPSKVAEAVEPLRAEAMERARQEAQALSERVLSMYAADNTIAAYPNRMKEHTHDYERKMRNYLLVCALTSVPKTDATSRKLSYHELQALSVSGRVANPELIEKFISEAVKMAEAAYTAFICKLEQKIGAHDAATLSGSHVWGYSTLTVCKGESKEYWRTQQIVNVSKKGKPFNQWPTRKVKG
jgi:hypothetical protein